MLLKNVSAEAQHKRELTRSHSLKKSQWTNCDSCATTTVAVRQPASDTQKHIIYTQQQLFIYSSFALMLMQLVFYLHFVVVFFFCGTKQCTHTHTQPTCWWSCIRFLLCINVFFFRFWCVSRVFVCICSANEPFAKWILVLNIVLLLIYVETNNTNH